MARTNPAARSCRLVVVVILEQWTAVAVPQRLRLEGASRLYQLHPATPVAAIAD